MRGAGPYPVTLAEKMRDYAMLFAVDERAPAAAAAACVNPWREWWMNGATTNGRRKAARGRAGPGRDGRGRGHGASNDDALVFIALPAVRRENDRAHLPRTRGQLTPCCLSTDAVADDFTITTGAPVAPVAMLLRLINCRFIIIIIIIVIIIITETKCSRRLKGRRNRQERSCHASSKRERKRDCGWY